MIHLQQRRKLFSQLCVAKYLALNITRHAAQVRFQFLNFPARTFHLPGMCITALHYQRLFRFARVRLAKFNAESLRLLHQLDA